MIIAGSTDSPHKVDATVNPVTPIRKIRRLP